MRLHITRNQEKGLMGGIKFELHTRVELTAEEAELVKKYKMIKQILLKQDVRVGFLGTPVPLLITIGSLTTGEAFKLADLGEILEIELKIKETCQTFKTYLELMKSFGGEEVIEYN